jgi:pyruvate/2-oxoglutarate dehydrogenase complex dihydrolipoamide acyltransferase (E2) component
MPTEVLMPQLGESVVEGKVSRWLKQEGDAVKQYEPILEVETDKVTTEITAADGGTLLRILVAEGLTVKAGTALAVIGQPGEEVVGAGHVSAPAVAAPQMEALGVKPGGAGGRVSPVVARIAAEHNVDVSLIQGTGEGGRVTKKDILAYVENKSQVAGRKEELLPWEQPGSGDLFKPTEEVLAPTPAAAPAPAVAPRSRPLGVAAPRPMLPGDELMPLSSMRRSIAEHMVKSKTASPHVTTVFEVDLSRVVAHREANKAAFERDGAKLTFTPYFVAASVAALKAYPQVNSSFTDEGLLLHKQINIGVAVSLGEEGLIVPVVHSADGKSLLGLALAVNDLAERARKKQLKPDEVVGSTFTLTNHGISGSLFATPIINQPNVGILGVGAIQKRVVVIGDAIAIRPMVYIGLTFDHRVLDGASGDWFVAKIKQVLENWA